MVPGDSNPQGLLRRILSPAPVSVLLTMLAKSRVFCIFPPAVLLPCFTRDKYEWQTPNSLASYLSDFCFTGQPSYYVSFPLVV